MFDTRQIIRAVAVLAAGLAACSIARAAFPERPVTIVVPFPAGSSADANVRVLAEEMKTVLSTPVVVDNRAGATGTIGAQWVARAAPNGYTLLYHSTAITINAWLNKEAPNPLKAFVPIAQVASTPYVIALRSSLKVRTVAELIAYARAKPGGLACATYGIGSPPHLALELFKRNAKVDILHVPYRGFSQAFADLNSGQLECAVDLPANVMQHVRSGLLHAVAVTAPSNLASVKDVPPLGYSVNVTGWSGFFAPAGTPPEVVMRLEQAVRDSLKNPAVLKGLDTVGMSPGVNTSRDEFIKSVTTDYEQFGEVIQASGIKAE